MSEQITLQGRLSAWAPNYDSHNWDWTKESYKLNCWMVGSSLGFSQMVINFNAPSDIYKYRKIESAVLELYCNGSKALDTDYIEISARIKEFDEDTINSLGVTTNGSGSYLREIALDYAYRSSDSFDSQGAYQAAKYGVELYYNDKLWQSTAYANVHSTRSQYPPRLKLTVSQENRALSITSTYPAAGTRLNRIRSNFFSASTSADGYSIETPSVQSGIFRWRKTGETAVYETATSGASRPSVTIPAGTFSGGKIDYQFELLSTSGNTAVSEWTTVSLEDTLSSARAVSPSETIVDGDKPAIFAWEHINASGAAQTGADIQISLDGTAWDTLATVASETTQYEVPAGSIASGTWYWRVRTYNLDGVAGSWSEPVRFVAVSSPTTPLILVLSSSPRPAVQWQTSEQTAYQLQLDGLLETSGYGPEKTWRCPRYLEDGNYTIRVRSQNLYGLWSSWGEAEITVENTSGPEFTLSVAASHEATLSWTGSGYDFYIVYRNGAAIAKTTEHTYTDRWSLGETIYQVRGCYSDNDNYGISAEVSVVIEPETIMIAPVDTGEWLTLGTSDSQHRTNKKKLSRTLASMQIAGRKYPVETPTEFYTASLSVSCAFGDRRDSRRLEALLGRLVCLKAGDDMVIGYMSSIAKSSHEFYQAFDFTVQQSDFREEINIDD